MELAGLEPATSWPMRTIGSLHRHRVRSLGECALTRSRDLSAKPTALMRDVGVLQSASAHLPEARSSSTRREALDEPAADRLVDCAAIRATGSDRGGSLPRSGRAVPGAIVVDAEHAGDPGNSKLLTEPPRVQRGLPNIAPAKTVALGRDDEGAVRSAGDVVDVTALVLVIAPWSTNHPRSRN